MLLSDPFLACWKPPFVLSPRHRQTCLLSSKEFSGHLLLSLLTLSPLWGQCYALKGIFSWKQLCSIGRYTPPFMVPVSFLSFIPAKSFCSFLSCSATVLPWTTKSSVCLHLHQHLQWLVWWCVHISQELHLPQNSASNNETNACMWER